MIRQIFQTRNPDVTFVKWRYFWTAYSSREMDEELTKKKSEKKVHHDSHVTYKTKKVQNDFLHPVKYIPLPSPGKHGHNWQTVKI